MSGRGKLNRMRIADALDRGYVPAMPDRIVVDVVVAVIGALVYAFAPPKADQLGFAMFFAGTLAALMTQH